MTFSIQPSARRQRGLTLIECLAHIAVLGVLISVGGYTVAKAWDQSRSLQHNATVIQRTLSIGERWRADIRAASDRIKVEFSEASQTVVIPTHTGEVSYEWREGQLRRRASQSGNWVTVFDKVRVSQMESFTQDGIRAWRWEIELPSSAKKLRVRPQFSFIAVPGTEIRP